MTLLLNLALIADESAVSVGIEKVEGANLTISDSFDKMNMAIYEYMILD